MPENSDIGFVDFLFKIHFNEAPNGKFLTEKDIEVVLIDFPRGDFRKIVAKKILSTWGDNPVDNVSDRQAKELFIKMLKGKTLPNPMEALTFSFLIKNITNVEMIYFLRHRTLSSILAKTSGEKDIRHNDIFIPNQIKESKYKDRYEQLIKACFQLYAEMTDDNISIMQSRMVLPKATIEWGYFTFNLKDFIAFINQRKCTQVHSNLMNLVVEKMYNEVFKIIPEIVDVVNIKCDKKCFWINAPLEENTRLTLPDKNHSSLFYYNPKNYFYGKTRLEMNDERTVQDD